MKRIWSVGIFFVVLGFAVIGAMLIFKSNGLNGGKTASQSKVLAQGNSGRYLYSIIKAKDQNKFIAQFDPTLPTDDDIVIGALKSVAKDSFRIVISADVQPTVETLNEVNYVTFKASNHKFLFELFRNSNGQVGSAQFWEE